MSTIVYDRFSYVYVVFDQFGVPRYVGKGKGQRWQKHTKSHNAKLRALLEEYGDAIAIVKVREGLLDTEAVETEIALIAAIGRRDRKAGPLFNRTDGGEGLSGYVRSEETRKRMSESALAWSKTPEGRLIRKGAGRKRSENLEANAKLSIAVKGFHARLTVEQRALRAARISEATRAAMTDEAREKIRASRKDKPLTEKQKAVIAKMAAIASSTDYVMTLQRKRSLDSMHAGNVGRHHSEETRAKMRVAHAKRLGAELLESTDERVSGRK